MVKVDFYDAQFGVPRAYVEGESEEDNVKRRVYGAINDPQVRCISEGEFYKTLGRKARESKPTLVGGEMGGRLQRDFPDFPNGAEITFGGESSWIAFVGI